MTQLKNQLDPFTRLDNIWHYLHPWQRKVILANAYISIIPRLHPPVAFSVRAMVAMFALLFIMPMHPMSLVIATGGGLSFALITH
jgi:hypothetical protein